MGIPGIPGRPEFKTHPAHHLRPLENMILTIYRHEKMTIYVIMVTHLWERSIVH